MALVSVKPKTLDWAVRESGYTQKEIEEKLKFPLGSIATWVGGDEKPNRTQFKKLANLLKRPDEVFFIDPPPVSMEPTVSMRFAFGTSTRRMSPEERVAIRDSYCIGRFIDGIRSDLGRMRCDLPVVSTNEDPEEIAESIRTEFFQVSVTDQMSLGSPSLAFKFWRNEVERLGLLVFLYSLGENSSRGFSFASNKPLLIGVSTTWHPTVRIYTLFHELGHVVTQTSSSCVEEQVHQPSLDPIERWCEKFAASFLMPRKELLTVLDQKHRSDPLRLATWMSNKLYVSRKAALLRLVEIGLAKWTDLRRLESRYEKRQPGGRYDPSQTRTRKVVRHHKYGSCLSDVRQAYEIGIVNESDIRDYLVMLPEEL